MKHTDPPIIVQETFTATVDQVWKSVTEPNQMQQWFFEQIKSFKAAVGFETEFLVAVADKTFTHQWRVIEVELNQRLKFQWRYEEYPGDSFVIFEMKPQDDKVKFTLTTEVVADFPDNIPEFKRESCIGGWNYFIKERLKAYLEKA